MTYYSVSKPTTTYYESSLFSIRTWKSLANVGATTWAKLKALGWDTWEKLANVRGYVTLYYSVSNPTTTYYEVTNE